jgi:hypothetical protein
MRRLLFGLPVIFAVFAVPVATHTAQWSRVYPIPHGPFYIQSNNGKCLTYGSGMVEIGFDSPAMSQDTNTAVYLADCASSGGSLPNQLALQRIVVKELNANHEVFLQAGTKVVGVMANFLLGGVPLELQTYTGAAGQIWVLDGDSLILKANRNLVVELKDGRTRGSTPIVIGDRDLDDAEFWSFVAVDGTNKKPTQGFVTASNASELKARADAASWGTVIEIEGDVSIPLDNVAAVQVRSGVTIRGDRRGIRPGAELTFDTYPQIGRMLEVTGDYARVTGLRLRGPSPTKDVRDWTTGVLVDDNLYDWTIIDHNELSGWTQAAVEVTSHTAYNASTDTECDPNLPVGARTTRVFRNFLHHNARAGLGYGVVLARNGFATILGNTFLYNRHAIAADGMRGTGYRAYDNLVLSDGPEYSFGIAEHDFDMHGSDPSSHHTGGIAGSDVAILTNTFLGGDRHAYDVRGEPCALHSFRANVSRQNRPETIHWYGQYSPTAPPPSWLEIIGNRFNSPDPTRKLGKGDFDGDGSQDLFLATGAAWYYAPGGVAEWRYLKTHSDAIDYLLFGDVDGDGRTDVVNKYESEWFVHWAGASKREKINEHDGSISDFALADFNGDGRADLFHTNGSQWLVSYSSTAPFTQLGYPSPYRLADLRLGDFNADGETDVFAVIGTTWFVRYSGQLSWDPLRSALTPSVANLLIADFDGNGRSDVVVSNSTTWKVSRDGVHGWTTLRSSGLLALKDAAAIGDFDGTPGADVLAWEFSYPPFTDADSRYLAVFPQGSVDPYRYSRNHMR